MVFANENVAVQHMSLGTKLQLADLHSFFVFPRPLHGFGYYLHLGSVLTNISVGRVVSKIYVNVMWFSDAFSHDLQ